MLGAIAGDVIGSVYERGNLKTTQFPLFVPGSRFTDDTVCTVALADSLLTGSDYAPLLKQYVRRYPDAGYGGTFFYRRGALWRCPAPYRRRGENPPGSAPLTGRRTLHGALPRSSLLLGIVPRLSPRSCGAIGWHCRASC